MDFSKIRTVVTHGNCVDGLVSAILIHDTLPNAEILFLQHGTEDYLNLKATKDMLFVDIAPPEARAREFVESGAYILDHHKTAKGIVRQFGDRGVFGDEVDDPGVCGAVLAYRQVFKPVWDAQPMRRENVFARQISELAGVRDTWQRQSPNWRAACLQHEIFSFVPRETWMDSSLYSICDNWSLKYEWLGEVLLDRLEKSVERTVKSARRLRTPKGIRTVIFEGTGKTSDAADLLGGEADLVIGFNFFEEDVAGGRATKMVVSTRSRGAFDCSDMCKMYGGGGHTKAAGFTVNLAVNDANPYNMIESLVSAYEVNQR